MTTSGGYALAPRCYALVSSKQRLLRYAFAARGWGCRGCVCAGVHWHCQGTQPHSTRFTTRAFHSNLICISCILVEGGRDISELCCLTRCRCCAAARCRQRLATRLLLASCLLEMSLACQFAHGTPQHAGCLLCPLVLPSLSRHWPGARRLGCALPLRFTGRRHSSTWQDTDTTATNLGQIRCRGICAF